MILLVDFNLRHYILCPPLDCCGHVLFYILSCPSFFYMSSWPEPASARFRGAGIPFIFSTFIFKD